LGCAPQDVLPVSYSGGVFHAPSIRAAFEEALGPGYDLREPIAGPAVGAALYARPPRGGAPPHLGAHERDAARPRSWCRLGADPGRLQAIALIHMSLNLRIHQGGAVTHPVVTEPFDGS
jgi:hypothetical protein